eukprot:1161173-Pelagomonas_calceolata.AAC.2
MGWSVEGLDYQVEMLRSSDPRARPAAARLQRELARLEAQLSEEPGAAGSEQQQNQQDSQAQEQQQQDRGTDGVVASREWGAGLAQGRGRLGHHRARRLQKQQQGRSGLGFGGGHRAGMGTSSQESGDGRFLQSDQGEQGARKEGVGMEEEGEEQEEGGQSQSGQGVMPRDGLSEDIQSAQPTRDTSKAAVIARAKERGLALKRIKEGRRGRRGA